MMRKKIIPIAAAASLTFGTAGLQAEAVELNEANENYAGILDWTEQEWNDYLGTNFGTSLDDYNSADELQADVGAAVDLDALANGDFTDANILEIMERYNMSGEELAAFLEQNDNRDNIHFIGDLENVLETNNNGGGSTDDQNATEEPEPADNPEPANPEEPADPEEPAADNETQTPSDGTANQDNSSGEGEALDMNRVEEVYLLPLGWTADEFSTYLEDNYDRPLDDFTQFENLEELVGPVLTDENEQELLNEYGLTPSEYETLLGEYGETPEDYNFVYELDDALAYYTSDEAVNAGTEKGAEMPETATQSGAWIMMGMFMAAVGTFTFFRSRAHGTK